MQIPSYYPVESDGRPDLDARRAYISKLCEFANWDGPVLDRLVIESVLLNHFDPNDDLGTGLLQYLRDQAYIDRLEYDICSILGDAAEGYDISDFAGVVADNWDGKPLESCDSFVNDQFGAVLELFGAYKAMLKRAEEDSAEKKADLDEDTLVSLRQATTSLAKVKPARDEETVLTTQARKLYLDIGADLKKRHAALFDQINAVAAMLWNARFPDHPLDEGTQVYIWSKHQSSGHIYPQFDSGPVNKGWDRDPMSLGYSRNFWFNHEALPAPVRGLDSVFRLTTSEGDGHHAFTLGNNGTWSFGHNSNWARIAGGVRSIPDFIKLISERLEQV